MYEVCACCFFLGGVQPVQFAAQILATNCFRIKDVLFYFSCTRSIKMVDVVGVGLALTLVLTSALVLMLVLTLGFTRVNGVLCI